MAVKNLKRIFFAAAVLCILAFVIISFLPEPKFSEVQEDTIDTFGYPNQFVVTYMPAGDENDIYLVRTEVWYYPEYDMQVTFSGGEIFNVEDYTPEDPDVLPTTLKPEDFVFEMDYSNVSQILNTENIDLIDMPGFYEQGVLETYLSDKALFIIENGSLSYIQTLGLGTKDIDLNVEDSGVEDSDSGSELDSGSESGSDLGSDPDSVLNLDSDSEEFDTEGADETGESTQSQGLIDADFTQEEFEDWLIMEYGEDVDPNELDEDEVVEGFLNYLKEKQSE